MNRRLFMSNFKYGHITFRHSWLQSGNLNKCGSSRNIAGKGISHLHFVLSNIKRICGQWLSKTDYVLKIFGGCSVAKAAGKKEHICTFLFVFNENLLEGVRYQHA